MNMWCVMKKVACFFSSRRRHTNWPRDWSSDVCSSDHKHEGTIIVKENPPSSNTPHDLLMKELLRQLYEPFIKAFYPKLYELIDFQSAKLLSEEMILNAFKGEKRLDRKSTRLNSSHVAISYAVFCLKKKNKTVNA